MRVLVLGACASLLAGAAIAQPYERDQPTYPNSGPPYGEQGYPDNTGAPGESDEDQGPYQGDQNPGGPYGADQYRDDQGGAYANGQYGRDPRVPSEDQGDRWEDRGHYDSPESYGGYRAGSWTSGVPANARYSGRVGASWRDYSGRYCTYRELTWTGDNGLPAYRWVPRCHY